MSNRTVFKYPVNLRRRTTRLCLSGPIVHIGVQPDGVDSIMVWAESGVHKPTTRLFQAVGTGGAVPEDSEHVGSVIDGAFVWHLYELKSE